VKWQSEGDRQQGEAELVVHMINLTAGRLFSEEIMSHPQYQRLSHLINKIYYQLCSYQKQEVSNHSRTHLGRMIYTLESFIILTACFLPATSF
jgi:hypothetical protein